MCFEELKEKASYLPMTPGVYIMRDRRNEVIYVGKAKKLKNRVSQYFQNTASHSLKTKMMVSKVASFEVIVAASEFEALVLECSLIKRHQPKYNILLKDGKGYPYIRVDTNASYPSLTMVNKIIDDGAAYYGPFGSRGITQDLLQTICISLKLPSCNRKFPQDIGKGRPCLNYHMKQCSGWCQNGENKDEYLARIRQAIGLLQGDYKSVASQIKEQMLEASNNLKFELAAELRDRLRSVETLGQKQFVTAGRTAETDVIGFYQNENKACFTVLHFNSGNLLDKEYEILSAVDEPELAISSLLSQFYLNRGYAPKTILLPFPLEDSALLEQLLAHHFNRRTKFHVPQKGDQLRLVELANANAMEEVERITSKEERIKGTLTLLGKMLNLPAPHRMEAFDISNISGTDIVGSMVVFVDGKPKKGEYKRFSVQNLTAPDDYASMSQVIVRRFSHLKENDAGFEAIPDLLLIDGGATHAQTALEALRSLQLTIPVFGMVKDNRHRTRALVTPDGMEIAIDTQQNVFSLIGTIQEEVHRFAITYHRQLRSKRLHYSELDNISGIGPKRKQELLKRFKSVSAIKNATLEELKNILPADAATNVFTHFQSKKGE